MLPGRRGPVAEGVLAGGGLRREGMLAEVRVCRKALGGCDWVSHLLAWACGSGLLG